MSRSIGLIATLAIAFVAATTTMLKHPSWTVDGLFYARMMLQDRGVPESVAQSTAERFFAQTELGRNPRALQYIRQGKPLLFQMQQAMYRSRPLYGYLASLLYGRFGFLSMVFINIIAYVLAAGALYWLLVQFVEPWLAMAVAVIAMLSTLPFMAPSNVSLATDETDLCALAFYIALLVAALYYIRDGRVAWLIVFGLATTLLAVTRPAVYLPTGAALGVIISGMIWRAEERVRRGLAILGVSIGVVVMYAVYMKAIHDPGLAGEIAYNWDRNVASGPNQGLSEGAWLALATKNMAVAAAKEIIVHPFALLSLIVAAFGLFSRRREIGVALLLGGSATLVIPMIVNPVPNDLIRMVFIPLLPAIACGVACFGDSTLQRFWPRPESPGLAGSP